jgi:hypothetical protein
MNRGIMKKLYEIGRSRIMSILPHPLTKAHKTSQQRMIKRRNQPVGKLHLGGMRVMAEERDTGSKMEML